MTATASEAAGFDTARVAAFADHMTRILSGSLLSSLVDIGHRTGLFVAAAQGWATSAQLADRAGLVERYVREWLAAMACDGVVEYDAATETFRLPAEHAALLTTPTGMAPYAAANTVIAKHVHQVARAFRDGGGVPYAAFAPEFTDAMDGVSRGIFDTMLVEEYLPLAPGLAEKLAQGVRVADIACGAGHALIVLARAFPASTFVGYDLDEHGLARARAEALGAGVANVAFEQIDVATLSVAARYDVIVMFDALHDQVKPDVVLDRIHDALVPGGWFFLCEPSLADSLAENLQNPMAVIAYAVSTLHCLTVSLAHDGAGIGTAFGEGRARRMLSTAGFEEPSVHPAPGLPFNAVYVTRRGA